MERQGTVLSGIGGGFPSKPLLNLDVQDWLISGLIVNANPELPGTVMEVGQSMEFSLVVSGEKSQEGWCKIEFSSC